MLPIQDHPSGISFKLRVQPRSSRNQIAGAQAEALKVKVTAPPAEGAANRACFDLLSKALDVPRSCLEITAGQSSRSKTIFVRCGRAAAARIRRRLEELAAA
jgi:uncharacterized protein